MKDPFDRTKVVLRRIHPAITEAALKDQIDHRFAGRYNWLCFRPGKNSQKNQRYSRAYIDLKKPEDVVEFAEVFGGHTVVNEKGAQFKLLVEYAPSQRVPKACSKKDVREGTILKDPEYLEFLEHLAKPVENLPSAEIQLERKEAERAGGPKDPLIVTPLMEFIRQKRAAKNGLQRSANGKITRRPRGPLPSSSSPSRRASEKRRNQTSVYVLRDGTRNSMGKDKTHIVSRREEQLLDKAASASVTNTLEDGNVPGGFENGKKRVVLLKGKEKEISNTSSGSSLHNNVTTSGRNSQSQVAFKQIQQNDASARTIRSILSNKDTRQIQSDISSPQSDQQTRTTIHDRDKRPPRPPVVHPIPKDLVTSSHRPVGRRGPLHGQKEVDSSPNFPEGKFSKRGGAPGYSSQERRVWVQKSGSGS